MGNTNPNKYISCDWVTSGIEFSVHDVNLCCFGYLQGLENHKKTILVENYKGESIDWDKIFARKKEIKELNKKNTPLDCCKNCIYMEERDWSEENFIDHLTLNHWTSCNSDCFYCGPKQNKEGKKNYKLLPVIKDMVKKDILKATSRSCVTFGGGEPTVLNEFEALLNLFLESGFKNIRINSSGIKYSKTIEKGLKMGAISLVISPDSGTKETYEKIKRVRCFDKVWENQGKYAKVQAQSNLVKSKYIIIPQINDNKEEIDKWFEKMLQYGIKACAVSVEQHWYFDNFNNFDDSIYESIKYIEEKAKSLDFDLEIYCEAMSLLQKGKNING